MVCVNLLNCVLCSYLQLARQLEWLHAHLWLRTLWLRTTLVAQPALRQAGFAIFGDAQASP